MFLCLLMIFPQNVGWLLFCFFFNDTATTEIYTLSLHDALPISTQPHFSAGFFPACAAWVFVEDRKSTRLNSSHRCISYAVFCLKKKKLLSTLAHLEKAHQNVMYKMDAVNSD